MFRYFTYALSRLVSPFSLLILALHLKSERLI